MLMSILPAPTACQGHWSQSHALSRRTLNGKNNSALRPIAFFELKEQRLLFAAIFWTITKMEFIFVQAVTCHFFPLRPNFTQGPVGPVFSNPLPKKTSSLIMTPLTAWSAMRFSALVAAGISAMSSMTGPYPRAFVTV